MEEIGQSINKILKLSQERMQKAVEAFKRDLVNIRSTRASTSMLDQVQVNYYGTPTPLNQLAALSVPEARMLLVSPYDKGAIGDIEKALLKSDIGITPQNDGSLIRLVMPELSRERRQDLVKQLKARLEDARVSLRNIRRDSNEEIKKLKSAGASQDELKDKQEDVQKLTDRYIRECEGQAAHKEQGIMSV